MNSEYLDAVKAGDLEKVRSLIASNPSLASARDESGVSALLLAFYHGRREVAQVLLDVLDDLDIFEACACGKVDRVEELLKSAPNLIGSFSSDGWTLLHFASFFGHPQVVKLLLENSASVSARSKNQMANTPLHAAMPFADIEVVKLLLAAGAEVNARQSGGYAAMHSAASQGSVLMAQHLLAHGADVNAKADDGKTPLAIAIEKQRAEVAELLRQNGARAD